MLPSKELCCLCRRALSSVLPDLFLWAADFSRPFASYLCCCKKWLILELVCVCVFEKKSLFCFLCSVLLESQPRGEWQRSSVPAVRHAALLSHVGGHGHCHLHEEEWHQLQHQPRCLHSLIRDYCPAASFQSVRRGWILCISLSFYKIRKERNVFCCTGKLCIVVLFPSLKLLSVCPHLEMVCDPLGDFNVWASTRPINNTAKGHKMWESVVIAAARVSPSIRAFLPYMSKSDRLEVSHRCTTVTLVCH